jgi:hypothetical protein
VNFCTNNGTKKVFHGLLIGYFWIKSDFRLICGYFFVTGNHNKTENEILSIRTIYNNKVIRTGVGTKRAKK